MVMRMGISEVMTSRDCTTSAGRGDRCVRASLFGRFCNPVFGRLLVSAGMVLMSLSASARAVDDLSLNVAPGSEVVVPGDTVTVTLDIANLSTPINGVQVLLSYNSSLLVLDDIVAEDLGLAPPASGWIEVSLSDTVGSITWAAVITSGSILADHTIATLTFTVIDEGATTINFQADNPPFLTKLTAEDNTTILPTKTNSGVITSQCDDGLYCNGLETFDGIVCQPGEDPCDDEVACTIDNCDEGTDTCTNTPDDAFCDDGAFCNGEEWCDAELDCQAGVDPCDDGVACTIDTCDEVADTCANTPDDSLCDDGLFCTGIEFCDPVLDCQAGTDPCFPLVCDEVGDLCESPVHIANVELFYAGRYGNMSNSSRSFLAVGSTANGANITNYRRGITGIRVTFDNVVTFATTAADAFSFEWTTGTGTTFSAVLDAATMITVTPTEQNGVTVVNVVISDDHVRRRWLKVTVDASQVTSSGTALDGELTGNPLNLPSGDGDPGGDAVFFIGNVTGDVDGDRKTTLTDVGQIRAQVNPFLMVPITNLFDIDKDGKVQLSDVGAARADVNPFFTLPLITP
jgi:hypothetical protein